MAITKETTEDRIEIIGDYKHLQVRSATVIKEDGTEISRSFHRKVIKPGKLDDSRNYVKSDVSGESAQVQAIANAAWTDAAHDEQKRVCLLKPE